MFTNDEEDFFRMSISKFENMLKTNKVCFFDSEEFENIILHYLDSGKVNLSKKALKLGLEQHPNSIGLKLVQVELLVFEDKLDKAEKLLNEIQAIDPRNDEVYIQRATIFSKQGSHQKAIECLNIALQYTDDFADVYSLLGMEYLYIDEIVQAKDAFIKCLEHDVEDQTALYNVVYCYDFLDNNKEAIEFLEEFIDHSPYSEVAWHQLGRQFYITKDYRKAIEAFDFACIIDEKFTGAYIEKGKAYEKLKMYQQAINCYKDVLQIEDPSSYVYRRIGACYEHLKNLDKALKYYLKSVHEDPLMDKSWIAIADLYLKKNDFKKALQFVNKALGIDEHNYLYWRRFAIINKDLLFLEEAELGFRKAIEHGDAFLDTWLFWSDTLRLLENNNDSIQKLLKARDIFNDEYEIEYRLVGLYMLTDQTEKALYHLTNALALNYKNRTLLQDLFPTVWENEQVQNYIQNFNQE
ncbi:tetratricopeptide repeat protein [Paenimyroides aestuarii]|uniref:Tetratricopeptide repeat protein n=1 Tax=Paenimyroides aestuarii TaxID=2968490 RepID=A0ABY5NRD8_9FLAO|nr:tetratricopeptide repeat protein [Paenimyroides aestuarii]UUV21130.1 tetratricopeptide repeat protein [Paenimyroides aestuarii]